MDGFIRNLEGIAVIGSGVIGQNWAVLFAKAGFNVNLYDVSSKQLEHALEDIQKRLTEYSDTKIGCVKVFNSLANCLVNVQYVQECVPESLEIKKQLFSQIQMIFSKKSVQNNTKEANKQTKENTFFTDSDLCELDPIKLLYKKVEHIEDDESLYKKLYDNYIIFASSSSGIPCSQFTQNLKIQSRCIISHPLNPPLFCPLVEIVPAPYTSPWVTKITYFLMEKIGQKPIVLQKEVLGFAVNRIQYALLAECWRLVEDGVLRAADVDKVMTNGLGLRYAFFGPFHNCHLNANGISDYIDRYGSGMQNVMSSFGPNPKFEDQTLKEIKLDMEHLTPLGNIEETRKTRELCLEKLAKLKIELGM